MFSHSLVFERVTFDNVITCPSQMHEWHNMQFIGRSSLIFFFLFQKQVLINSVFKQGSLKDLVLSN